MSVKKLEQLINQEFDKHGWYGVVPLLPVLGDAYKDENEWVRGDLCHLPWRIAIQESFLLLESSCSHRMLNVRREVEWCFGIECRKNNNVIITTSSQYCTNKIAALVEWRDYRPTCDNHVLTLKEMPNWCGIQKSPRREENAANLVPDG